MNGMKTIQRLFMMMLLCDWKMLFCQEYFKIIMFHVRIHANKEYSQNFIDLQLKHDNSIITCYGTVVLLRTPAGATIRSSR